MAQGLGEGAVQCGVELHRRGRKRATLVHADHDAARTLLLEASAIYDEFHEAAIGVPSAARSGVRLGAAAVTALSVARRRP